MPRWCGVRIKVLAERNYEALSTWSNGKIHETKLDSVDFDCDGQVQKVVSNSRLRVLDTAFQMQMQRRKEHVFQVRLGILF